MSIMDKLAQARALLDEIGAHFKQQHAAVWGETTPVVALPAPPVVQVPVPTPAAPLPTPPAVDPDSRGYEYEDPAKHAPVPAPPPAPAVTGSAVANVQAILAAGVAKPGKRASDGRLVFSQYGGPTDRTPDSLTQAAKGNRGNTLNAMSVALSRDLIAKLSPKGGDDVVLEVDGHLWPVGHYDDSTGPDAVNCIDAYDPGDLLGQDTFMAVVPAGTWTLRVGAVSLTGAVVPIKPTGDVLTRDVVSQRVHSVTAGPCTYELGMEPHLLTWTRLTGAKSDCSGFMDACFGIDRNVTGENTDAVWHDAAPGGAHKYYEDVVGPARPFDCYVQKSGPTPDGKYTLSYGHCGVVTAVDDHGVPTGVAHCSSMNPDGRSIQETDTSWFVKHGAKVVRAVALKD